MNSFIYDIPVKVYFGGDQLCHLGEELGRYGKRVLMTYGGGSIKKSGLYDKVVGEIRGAGLELFELAGIDPNPRIDTVREGARLCKEKGIDVLLAVGGGSTLDATKWMAATGSEMDGGGVITNPETNDKLGRIVSPTLLPKVSFPDPSVTYTVSRYQTACGSADILSHVMEQYFNMEPDLYMLDCFMEGLMKTVVKYAPVAMEQPENYEARANLMWASSWAINGFATGGKQQAWSCHPMEHELSAFYDITHGLGLAILTPRWMEYCLDETTVSKYVQFGVNVFNIDPTLEPMEIARKSIEAVSGFLFDTLGLKRTFTEIGIDRTNFSVMAKKACGDGVLPGFKPLAQEDMEKIFEMCL